MIHWITEAVIFFPGMAQETKSQLRVTFLYKAKPLNQSIPLSLLSAKWVGVIQLGKCSQDVKKKKVGKKSAWGYARPASSVARMLASC